MCTSSLLARRHMHPLAHTVGLVPCECVLGCRLAECVSGLVGKECGQNTMFGAPLEVQSWLLCLGGDREVFCRSTGTPGFPN